MTKKQNTLAEIAEAVKSGKTFFVAGHQNPDGDSLGCTLAISSVLRRMGKRVYSYADNPAGRDLDFLPMLSTVHIGQKPPQDFEPDTVIMLECSDESRGGDLDKILKSAATVINIDHHLTSETYGDYNYINPSASSTAEIMWSLLEIMQVYVNPDEATCLYTGLITDTGRFLHSNTTAEAMRAGSCMLAAGADVKSVNKVLFFTKSYVEMKLLGRALEKLQLISNGKIAVIILTLQDFKLFNAEPSYTQGIVSQPVMIPGVEVSLLVKEEADKISVNLRSQGRVDVSAIAAQFGGGGHARAAGFKKTGVKLEELTKELIVKTEAVI